MPVSFLEVQQLHLNDACPLWSITEMFDIIGASTPV
jgi:hypothetical protein